MIVSLPASIHLNIVQDQGLGVEKAMVNAIVNWLGKSWLKNKKCCVQDHIMISNSIDWS